MAAHLRSSTPHCLLLSRVSWRHLTHFLPTFHVFEHGAILNRLAGTATGIPTSSVGGRRWNVSKKLSM
jgi:hypothetical protein